jgi:hypothetical protein
VIQESALALWRKSAIKKVDGQKVQDSKLWGPPEEGTRSRDSPLGRVYATAVAIVPVKGYGVGKLVQGERWYKATAEHVIIDPKEPPGRLRRLQRWFYQNQSVLPKRRTSFW